MIEFSELKELPKIYAKVCQQIENPAKKKNGVHNAKYADLDEVINCSKKVLANHGFTIIQYPLTNDGKIGVETMLMHESGEYIKGSFCVPFNNNDPQKVGGAITYYRRYSLVAMLNLVGENDDDADSISQHAQNVKNNAPQSDKQKKFLLDLLTQNNLNNPEIHFKLKDRTKAEISKYIELLKDKKKNDFLLLLDA